jgi:hypothetical protein
MSSHSFIPVKGTGMAVEKEYNVADFQSIDVSGGFDVILLQGDAEGVTLEVQENLLEYIHVEVVQGTLKIYTDNNLMPTKSMSAQIKFKTIDELSVSGGGDVHSETTLNTGDLKIEISGGGDLTTAVNSENLECNMSGGGDARFEGMCHLMNIQMSGGGDLKTTVESGSISCHLSGGGDLTLTNLKESSDLEIQLNGGGDATAEINTTRLKCSVSGGGNARFSGNASEIEITINGGGDVNAEGLDTKTASINASGGSDIHVNVSDELNANISGGGDIYYSGSPEIVSIDARGGSEAHKQ